MYTLFKANANKPPIFKNQPPVAGAISWERSLFLRIKHTILRFQEMEDMLNSEQGKLVRTLMLYCMGYKTQCDNWEFQCLLDYVWPVATNNQLTTNKLTWHLTALNMPTFLKSNVWDFCLHITWISEDFVKSSNDYWRFFDEFQRWPNISDDFRVFPKIFHGLPNLAVTCVCVKNSSTSDRVGLTHSFAGVFFPKIWY